jgi:hypothetical protein
MPRATQAKKQNKTGLSKFTMDKKSGNFLKIGLNAELYAASAEQCTKETSGGL